MTILQVLYLLEAARVGSLSRAAENLFVSQPALSLQIKRLEEELGCALFRRDPQGVTLTAAGQAFRRSAEPVEEAWKQLAENCRRLDQAVCRQVRIGMGPRAISNGMLDLVSTFFDRHPDTAVSFTTDIGIDLLAALEENQIDLALDRLPPKELLRNPGHFAVSELTRERQCILLSPDDPRAGREALPFREMDGSAAVTGPEDSPDDRIMRSACRQYGVRLPRTYRADNLETVMALIRRGKGFTLGPASFAQRYAVAAVPVLPESQVSLNLICLKRNYDNSLVRNLERYIKAQLPPLPR